MLSRLPRAIEIYRTEGGAVLGRRLVGSLRRVSANATRSAAFYRAVLTGRRTLQFGGARATFRVTRDDFDKVYDNVESERALYDRLLEDLRPTDVVWDVGANVGTVACLAGDVVRRGHVVTFEPHPLNLVRLETNLRENDVSATVLGRALSDEEGELEMVMWDGRVGSGLHDPQTLDTTDRRMLTVPAVRGDDLVRAGDVPSPTVLKIDVEGAELSVLYGLEETLRGGECRSIYCEVHADRIGDHGGSVEELRGLLEGWGYTLTTIQERNRDFHVLATRT